MCIRDRGVCLDTCHIWDAGYDIADHLDDVISEFDRIIGLDRLKAIHLNDSLNPLGAHKDRHARLGEGHIGPVSYTHLDVYKRQRRIYSSSTDTSLIPLPLIFTV